jgi:NADPH:quinone reductase-like Zn-dependent oxidoreductase
VLIHGGAGNVGSYAVQLAHRAGLHVYTTGSKGDLPGLLALGADEAIDYRATAFEDAVADVDAVIDLVGGETQRQSFNALRRGGVLVSAVSKPDEGLAQQNGVQAGFFLVEVRTDILTKLADMVGRGELKVSVGTVLPFSGARLAHEMLEGTRPHSTGKIVLSVDS